jgi:hypothetical protein
MKYILPSLVLCTAFLCGFPHSGLAQHAGDALRQKVQLDTKQATTDDYLLELARKSQLNFLADATDLAPTPVAPTNWNRYAKNSTTESFLADLASHSGISWTLRDAKTLLFWQPPSLDALRQGILAGADIRLPIQRVEGTEFLSQWQKYLQQTHDWDKRGQDFQVQVQISNLPLSLREQTIAAIQAHLLEPSSIALNTVHFTDEFWKTASVRLMQMGAPGEPERLMLVTRGKRSIRLSTLDFIRAVPVKQK